MAQIEKCSADLEHGLLNTHKQTEREENNMSNHTINKKELATMEYVYQVMFITEEYDLIACYAESEDKAKELTLAWIKAFDESLIDPEEGYGEFMLMKIRINSIGSDEDCRKDVKIPDIRAWLGLEAK